MNNQRNFAEAIQQHVTSKDYFPGYRQLLPVQNGTTSEKAVISWQVAMLPNIGKTDVYQAIQAGAIGLDSAHPLPYLEISTCPSDNSISGRSSPWTSYVANCGQLDTKALPYDIPANGIFQDRAVGNTKVSLTDIKDGQATTLMLTENVDAHFYQDATLTHAAFTSPLNNAQINMISSAVECTERGAGFVWWDTSTSNNNTPPSPPPTNAPPVVTAGINGQKGDHDPTIENWPTSPYKSPAPSVMPLDTKNYAARPSSYHPGGVVATFAGGNYRFLREDIDYPVYCMLMTPNGAGATTLSPKWQLSKPLDEGSL